MDVVLQDDLLGGVVEANRGQPSSISLGPATLAGVDPAMAQKETLKVLPRLAEHSTRRRASSDQIAHRFVRVVWHPDFRQLAGPVQFGQRHRIAAVGLNPITRPTRDQRRRDHDAILAQSAQQPVQAVAARTGLVTEVKPPARPPQLLDQAS